MNIRIRSLMRPSFVLAGAVCCAGLCALPGCDKEVSSTKTTTTRTTDTPEGTKKTTETTEKKVETERKEPR
ncbi:MAG: hypothetical protein U0573_05745 [Phycisphaerales bacterium]|nr:hypothetical protein [Planctomycetota bacterium]